MMRLFFFWGMMWLISLCSFACSSDHTPSHELPFTEKTSIWISNKVDQMSIDEKINQLILLKTSPRQILAEDGFQQYGGYLIESREVDQFYASTKHIQSSCFIPAFIGTQQSLLVNQQFGKNDFPSTASLLAASNDSLKQLFLQTYQQQLDLLNINWLHNNNTPNIPFEETYPLLNTGIKLTDYPYQTSLSTQHNSAQIGEKILQIDTIERLPNSFLSKQLFDDFKFKGLLQATVKRGRDVFAAIKAGADQVLVKEDANMARDRIKRMLNNGQLSMAELDWKVRRILATKATLFPDWDEQSEAQVLSVAHRPKRLSSPWEKDLKDYFNHSQWALLKRKVYKESIVLLNNPEQKIPIQQLHKPAYRILQIGELSSKVFDQYFGKYTDAKTFHLKIKKGAALPQLEKYLPKGWKYVITLNNIKVLQDRDQAFLQSLKENATHKDLILVNFGDPLNLTQVDSSIAMLQVFDWNDQTNSIIPQILFGGIPAKGKLPVTINDSYHEGYGLRTKANRLEFGLPEEVGISSRKLVGIDAIAKTAIRQGATPGCQVLVAKNGKVIYSRAFGEHDYQNKQAVKTTDLYDIASITKVAATTLASMKMYEQSKLKIDDRLKNLLDVPSNSRIKNLSLRKLLTHQSGLKSHLPVVPYLQFRDVPNAECDTYFCKNQSADFPIQIADQFYFKQAYQEKIWTDLHQQRLYRTGRYKYSDANFILLQKVIETRSNLRLDTFVNRNFYYPLGLRHLGYHPLNRFDKKQIIPTQLDDRWRHQLVHGYVHDETAGLFGGVAGNAGLFSNAEDLAVLFQMLLNNGAYGGKQYLKESTINLFTKPQGYVKRGLGFDKPSKKTYTAIAKSASKQSFGHTGFTGTCVWADPQNDLIFVFLSNRLHPNVKNRKLFKNRVRERIHQVIYDALDTYEIKIPETPKLDQAKS